MFYKLSHRLVFLHVCYIGKVSIFFLLFLLLYALYTTSFVFFVISAGLGCEP
jgi:hypothetical protein